MLDFRAYDPAKEENHPQLRIVLNLLKLAREQELPRFFEWLGGTLSTAMSHSLLSHSLLSHYSLPLG